MTLLKESESGKDVKLESVPVDKTLILSYILRSTESVQILELNQHKSPREFIKSIKDINALSDYMLTPE